MHEASIVRELLTVVAERAGRGARVLEVQVDVGRLTGVSPDAMRFYFDALRDDTLGPQARLEARLTALRGHSVTCRTAVELDDLTWACAGCGGPLVFDNGSELTLCRLVVDHE
jgi:hydrogenase nickel incorporation protein HypA/HybF